MVVIQYLFPLAAAVNFFSITALFIIVGLFGNKGLSADIAIIQAATIALFLSFSGNARSLILGGSNRHYTNLFYFRLLLLAPVSYIAYYLSISIVDLSTPLAIGLIIRKISEWFAELQLANKEKQHDVMFAFRYCLVNGLGLLVLIVVATMFSYDVFIVSLFFWALIPLFFILDCFKSLTKPPHIKALTGYFPHVGSTAVIGFSTYLFRVLIYLLVGKVMAGSFFTAYAIGGVISSLYTQAIGPTMIHRNKAAAIKKVLKYAFAVISMGCVVSILATVSKGRFLDYEMLLAIGISLIGGGVMLVAQHYRLHIIQVVKRDVFVPDAMANMLLISSVPFAYYLFQSTAFYYLFLWTALLNLAFYLVLGLKITLREEVNAN